jgi:hypothetical protein
MPERGENVNFDLLAPALRSYFQAVSSIAAPCCLGSVASKLTNIEPVDFCDRIEGGEVERGDRGGCRI